MFKFCFKCTSRCILVLDHILNEEDHLIFDIHIIMNSEHLILFLKKKRLQKN
jgi:hypothetical protein